MATSALKSLIAKAHHIFKLRLNPVTPTATIDAHRDEKFDEELQSLSVSMNMLNADNTGLHKLIDRIPPTHQSPITFIQVCENSIMCAVIIVLHPGCGNGIPLHDHPGMYGLLKVLHGQIRVKTYSSVGETNNSSRVIPTFKCPDVVLSRHSTTQTLTPASRNIHQIEYVAGEGDKDYAAFLDILSPPYRDDIGCHYYKEVEESGPSNSNSNSSKLIETKCPTDYYTSSVQLDQQLI